MKKKKRKEKPRMIRVVHLVVQHSHARTTYHTVGTIPPQND